MDIQTNSPEIENDIKPQSIDELINSGERITLTDLHKFGTQLNANVIWAFTEYRTAYQIAVETFDRSMAEEMAIGPVQKPKIDIATVAQKVSQNAFTGANLGQLLAMLTRKPFQIYRYAIWGGIIGSGWAVIVESYRYLSANIEYNSQNQKAVRDESEKQQKLVKEAKKIYMRCINAEYAPKLFLKQAKGENNESRPASAI